MNTWLLWLALTAFGMFACVFGLDALRGLLAIAGVAKRELCWLTRDLRRGWRKRRNTWVSIWRTM